MRSNNIEQVIEFLEKQGIKAKNTQEENGTFNRVIEFEVENVTYYIEWWVNQSYLKFKNEYSSTYLPFKYISVNPNSPTSLHRLQLCFYDELEQGDKESIFYNPMPFGCMRIPFNFKKNKLTK